MTPHLETFLKARASAVAATPAQRQTASRSEKYLRDVLDTGQFQHRILESFLIGSYARRTALQPLDDVDIVFLVDHTHWHRTGWQKFIGALPEPDLVLQSFASAIRYRYPQSGVRVQTRSVGLVMSRLHIDVVPAVRHQNNPSWIRVPDRDAATWINSGPEIHSRTVTEINQAMGGLLLPIIRLLKAWNSGLPGTARLKGFAVETLATRFFQQFPSATLADGVMTFFDFVAALGGHDAVVERSSDCGVSFSRFGRLLPDIAGTGSNLLAKAEHERLAKFAAKTRVTRDAVNSARNARSAETVERQLGRHFPE